MDKDNVFYHNFLKWRTKKAAVQKPKTASCQFLPHSSVLFLSLYKPLLLLKCGHVYQTSKERSGWMRRLMPEIPALWECEAADSPEVRSSRPA